MIEVNEETSFPLPSEGTLIDCPRSSHLHEMTRLPTPLAKMGSMRSTVASTILCINFVRISIVIGLFRIGANAGCISRGSSLLRLFGLGVIAQIFSPRSIEAALDACGVRSERRRELSLEAMGLSKNISTREVLHCVADGLRLVAPGVALRISG